MGTITIRFNDEEEKDNPRNSWRTKFAAQHFLENYRHGEFREQSRRHTSTRRWSSFAKSKI